ncbi:substrate-binding periplasmic protein [Silvanigrella aquatica]|uniref:Solute-binding protein family 3/N-terminal domain-containing protein n=1 Tax=Silvanigrella aquatica TaxID=1915309 RepID=A0A1L4D0H2_9BACT|nr:transporter substrate-binding domain-containing protein [Silvanigrella aquatica]APJ03688.1 hypothetical protein AXG55_07125 [Silvanigrella aquatica]
MKAQILFKIILIIISLSQIKGFCTEITLLADPSFTGEIQETPEKGLGGLGGEIVAKALKAKNIKIKIEWRPWTRAVIESLDNKDNQTFIIPLVRIPEREEKFVWVSKIYNAHTAFITMKHSRRIDTILAAKGATIGVLASSSYRAILVRPENGLKIENIDEVPIDIRNFKKLIGKRIDAWFTINIVAYEAIKTMAKEEHLTVKDFVIGKPTSIQAKYIATTKKTSPQLIKKVRDAVEAFKLTAEYKKIISRIPNSDSK